MLVWLLSAAPTDLEDRAVEMLYCSRNLKPGFHILGRPFPSRASEEWRVGKGIPYLDARSESHGLSSSDAFLTEHIL